MMPSPSTIAGAATTAITLFPKIVDNLQQIYDAYGKPEMKEIHAIQEAYKFYCYSLEKEKGPSTLMIDVEAQGKLNPLPIYFQMDPAHPKVPVLYQRKFCPSDEIANWVRLMSKTHLRHVIEEMLSYICQYQYERNDRMLGRRGYNYDPTNLFCEEFKSWLIKLSEAPLTQDTADVLEGRIKYLNDIYVNNVFKPGNDVPTRDQIISKIIEILKNGVIPIIELNISRTSAREDFDDLKINVHELIKNSIAFLFYVFRDTKEVPMTFILDQIRSPNLIPRYKNSLESHSGKLMQCLVNSHVFKMVFPKLHPSDELIEDDFNNITKNDFLVENGLTTYPLTQDLITKFNWYEDKKSGILGVFRTPENMNNFLKFHGLLQKLAVFYLICDVLHELAGDGGNLMVYGLAAHKVKQALKTCEQLIDETGATLNALYNKARDHFDTLKNDVHNKSDNILAWKSRFKQSDNFSKLIVQAINNCRDKFRTVQNTIKKVNDEKYLQKVKSRLVFFSGLVDAFSQDKLLSHSPIEEVAYPRELLETKVFNSNKLPEDPGSSYLVAPYRKDGIFASRKEMTESELESEFKKACTLYDQAQYKEAENILSKIIISKTSLEKGFYIELLGLRANTYVASTQYDLALEDLAKVAELNPGEINVFLKRAILLTYKRYYKEALADVSHVLADLDENNAEAIKLKTQIINDMSIHDQIYSIRF